ncbi:MAG: lactate racemase domain-containing protein [Anaerolineae bacterium]
MSTCDTAIGLGRAEGHLTSEEVATIVSEGLARLEVDGRRVLVIIPDGTRTMPMARFYDLFSEFLGPRVSALDYLVALGTHMPMDDACLSALIGHPVRDGMCGRSHILNHAWDDPSALAQLGTIPASEIDALTKGLFSQDVPVRLNKRIYDYDQIIICGPVFPHEVVGFSGGNKYFFPGIAGREIIDFTHWLGAVMTNYAIIGAGYTPVRAVIDRAAAFIDKPAACFCLVNTHGGLHGLYFGSPALAWEAASELSSQVHIVWLDKPVQRVLSVMPTLYDDLWTAAKGMYKMEPAVADGGEVVIYAPHITEVSYTHGRLLDEIGYHCRDYFLKQWERFKDYPGGVLAHSTHCKGLGTYDPATGIETPRITVTLATGIPRERCERINLGYLDPATVDIAAWQARADDGVLVVPRAGEMLYKIRRQA